jgi:DNA repair exonuclease SbcCD ATPase subunit
MDINLPCKGALLLVGPNGLGKTSVFDAVEWALTGEVRRVGSNCDLDTCLRSHVGQRPGVEPWVSLTFASEEAFEITRTASTPPDPARLERLVSSQGVRAAPAEVTRHIGDYLHTTHLLVQDRQARYVARERNQRWVPLSRLSGAAVFSEAQATLGMGLKRAITEVVSTRTKQVQDLQAEQNKVKSAIERRDRACKGAGLPSEEALFAAWRDAAAAVGIPFPEGDVPAMVSERVADMENAATVRAERLSRLVTLVADWSPLAARRSVQQGVIEAAVHRQEASRESLKVSSTVREQASQHRDATGERHAVASSRQEYLAQVEGAVNARNQAERNLVGVTQEVSNLASTVEAARVALEGARQRARQASEAKILLSSLQERLDRADSLAQSWSQARAKANLSEDLQDFGPLLSGVRNRLDLIRQDLKEARRGVGEATRRAEVHRSRQEGIAAAVGQIAAWLTDEHQDCPVCGWHWETGLLRRVPSRPESGVEPVPQSPTSR